MLRLAKRYTQRPVVEAVNSMRSSTSLALRESETRATPAPRTAKCSSAAEAALLPGTPKMGDGAHDHGAVAPAVLL